MKPILIVGSYLSPYVRKVLVCLEVKGMAYEVDHIVPFFGDDRFSKLSPLRRIPVLVDGDLVLPESAAIVLYLAEKYPEKKLMPAKLEQRAQVYRWVLFAVTELEQPLWRMAKHTFLYPEHKRLPLDIDLAREDFTAMAAVLERHMQGRRYIVGDHVTVADCVTAYLMDWANEHHLLDGLPNLKAYLQRMYQRTTAPQRIAEALATIRAA